jgi:hypothetical protein
LIRFSVKEVGVREVMISDISRAFFEAEAKRDVCVRPPPEDEVQGEEGRWAGKLVKSMYGTRDAAINWQDEVARVTVGWGFVRGERNPCIFYLKTRDLRAFVHGDDFASSGSRMAIDWSRGQLGRRFDARRKILGGDEGE